MRNAMRKGFTLVELLVVLILLGILTAIVFPIVVQQIDDAEPTKIANDLVNIRTGVEVFRLNVRPRYPGDLEDLAHQVDNTEDDDIEGVAFSTPSNEDAWNGPYIDATIAEDDDNAQDQRTGNAILTGFNLQIQNQVVCYDITANTFTTGAACTQGTDFVAILVGSPEITTGTPGPEFEAVDGLLDDGDGVAAGKIRAAETDGTVLDASADVGGEFIVYLIGPFTG